MDKHLSINDDNSKAAVRRWARVKHAAQSFCSIIISTGSMVYSGCTSAAPLLSHLLCVANYSCLCRRYGIVSSSLQRALTRHHTYTATTTRYLLYATHLKHRCADRAPRLRVHDIVSRHRRINNFVLRWRPTSITTPAARFTTCAFALHSFLPLPLAPPQTLFARKNMACRRNLGASQAGLHQR